MIEDELHLSVKTHIGGIFVAAADLIRKMDRPGMTIEQLRGTHEAGMFRRQTADFSNWMEAAMTSAPDSVAPPEYRRFLSHWFNELKRMENR